MLTSIVVLEAEVRKCRAEIYLNGIPFLLLSPESGSSVHGAPVMEFLIGGTNTLSALINPGPTPSIAGKEHEESAPGAQFSAKLMQYAPGAVSGDGSGREVTRLEWRHTTETIFPIQLQTRANPEVKFQPWKWQQASVLVLDDALRQEAQNVLELAHAQFAAGDGDGLAELARVCFTERAEAQGEDLKQQIAMFRRMLAVESTGGRWQIPPLRREIYDFRLCAGGRMLDCVAKDWKPILRSDADPNKGVTFGMFLAWVDGALRIVR